MASVILSVRIDDLSMDEILLKVRTYLVENRLHHIVPVNPEFIMATRNDPDLVRIVNESDLTTPDGVGLKFAAKILKVKVGARVHGVDLAWQIAKLAAADGHSMFLLGAAEGVAAKAAERLKEAYPSLKIAGTYSGNPDEEGLVDRINGSGADILLVAFGVPKQEKFVYRNKNSLKTKVAMSVGGSFDFIAGVVPRAPGWMRAAGLEWLYRLIRQPERFNRIITATVRFPVAVLAHRAGHTRNGTSTEHA